MTWEQEARPSPVGGLPRLPGEVSPVVRQKVSNFNAVQIKVLKKTKLGEVCWSPEFCSLGNAASWGGVECLRDRKSIQTVTENLECLGC